MPPTKKRRRPESDLGHEGQKRIGNDPSNVTKKIMNGVPDMKTNQVFGPESIKIFLDGIEIKKTDKSWYTLKSFGEILDMGESQNKPGERIFDFLYECACKHYPLKSSDENYDQRKRASNRFDLAWDVGTQIGDPMGLFIFNLLYANGNRLTSFSRANASFRKAVADEVASKLKLALPDNQTSTFDDMYVIWPPELFRRMMEFKNTKEVKLELPYGAGIQIDSPFVKFGNIKSLLQSDDELLDQFINPDCLAVTSPFLDRSYKASISFTTSQQVQDGSHEAWRCQKSDGVMETGICLGEQTLFLRTEWGKLHDPILVQLMEDLVAAKYLKRGETAVCLGNVFFHVKGPLVTLDGYFQIIIPMSPKEVKEGEKLVFLGVREDNTFKKWPVLWSPKTGYVLDSGTFIWPLTAIDYIAISFPKR